MQTRIGPTDFKTQLENLHGMSVALIYSIFENTKPRASMWVIDLRYEGTIERVPVLILVT